MVNTKQFNIVKYLVKFNKNFINEKNQLNRIK